MLADDEDLKAIWRAYGRGRLTDAQASAAAEAAYARRASQRGNDASVGKKTPLRLLARLAPTRREKVFGMGRPKALDRNAKARITHYCRALMRRTGQGKHYGAITAKAFAVLQALLWGFHNAKSGLCFPSYDRIAEAAGCNRCTVLAAIRALETAGILTWVNRLKRIREAIPGLPGIGATKSRVFRTSNAYRFVDPQGAGDRGNLAKSELPPETAFQAFVSLSCGVGGGGNQAKRLFEGNRRKFESNWTG
jgi:hypothetical protein